MRKTVIFLVSILLLFSFTTEVFAETATKDEAESALSDLAINAKSAILIEAKISSQTFLIEFSGHLLEFLHQCCNK